MKISEITEAFSAWDTLKSQAWKDLTPAGRAGLERPPKGLPTKYPTPASATAAKPAPVSTTVPSLKPGEIGYLNLGGQIVFYNQKDDKWYYFYGKNWPLDLNLTHPVELDKADAIAAKIAAGGIQTAVMPKKPAAGSAP